MANSINAEDAGQMIRDLREHDRIMERKASDLADLLAPRVRHADHASLKTLKLALRNYNANTGTWKDTPQK